MDGSAIAKLATNVVVAYVSRNHLPPSEVLDLIGRVHAGLSDLAAHEAERCEVSRRKGTQIAASVRPNRLVSFINGKRYKSLKWHLSDHHLTPDEYIARYGLPKDYPMVAPAYTARLRRRGEKDEG